MSRFALINAAAHWNIAINRILAGTLIANISALIKFYRHCPGIYARLVNISALVQSYRHIISGLMYDLPPYYQRTHVPLIAILSADSCTTYRHIISGLMYDLSPLSAYFISIIRVQGLLLHALTSHSIATATEVTGMAVRVVTAGDNGSIYSRNWNSGLSLQLLWWASTVGCMTVMGLVQTWGDMVHDSNVAGADMWW